MKTRTVTEYRVLVQRQGNAISEVRYRLLKRVEKRIGLLTSDEPWRFYDDAYKRSRGPDDYACCDGDRCECGCGGLTMREATEERRSGLPPIEWIRVECRQITTTAWVEQRPIQKFDVPPPPPPSPEPVSATAIDYETDDIPW
jgi:hypothetical protein